MAEALVAFADNAAVLDRGKALIMGIDSIRIHFSYSTPLATSPQLEPDSVGAAASGDLGYTFGKFIYSRWVVREYP